MLLNRLPPFLQGIGFLLAGCIVTVFSFSELYGGHGPDSFFLAVAAWLSLTAGFFALGFGIAWVFTALFDVVLKGRPHSRGFAVGMGLLIGGIITALFGYAQFNAVYSLSHWANNFDHTELERIFQRLLIAWSVTAGGGVACIVGLLLAIRVITKLAQKPSFIVSLER